MIDTNVILLEFLAKNWLGLTLLVVSIFRIVPPEWSGFWKYNNNNESEGLAPKITPINFLLTGLLDSVIRAFFIPLIATFGLKNMITLIIFIVVFFDIFSRHQISGAAVTLVSIGIITLYLERLIELGKHIELFGKLLIWDKDNSKK
ncbi:MAG: hypothetical protein WAV40_04335 [Microgenomates group bacterium]